MDNKAFFKPSYGLYLVTSSLDSKDSGCIANTFVQVTSDPQQVCITLNKNNYTTSLIEGSCKLNVSVLLENVDMQVISDFGFRSGKDVDKFKDYNYETDVNNIKYITDGMAATFACTVNKMVDVGTHIMFICNVDDCKVLSEKQVLTYENYHKLKNGTTPKNAPSYQEETTKHGWRCSVCGYIYEDEELPDDYICPVCKQPASVFEKV